MAAENTSSDLPPITFPFDISQSITDQWKLRSNRTELLKRHKSPLNNGESCDFALVGVVVFRKPTPPTTKPLSASSSSSASLQEGGEEGKDEPKILVVKRAMHDSFPGKWEVPGGGIEATDLTIAHAVARELREETSLVITRIIAELKPAFFVSFKDIRQDDGSYLSKRRTYAQLVYVVEVEDQSSFTTDPNEHSEGFWASRQEVLGLAAVGDMRKLILDAFDWYQFQREGRKT